MGTLTISLDFEIGWGAIETGLWRMRQQRDVYQNLRSALQRVTNLLDDLEISLTWAIVGAMISDPQTADFDHLPEPFQSAAKEFLLHARETSRDGRDLFELIAGMRTWQDIGSHTFSHTRFHAPQYSETAKRADIEKAQQALNIYGIAPRSFVFPVNQASDFEILERSGLQVVRLAPPSPNGIGGKLSQKFLGFAPCARRKPETGSLFSESGSLFYNWGTRPDWRFKRILLKHQLRQGFKKITRSDHRLHLWLHPFNLTEAPHLERDFVQMLTGAAQLRDSGKLEILPMSVLR